MLTSCTTENTQNVVFRVETTRLSQGSDRSTHSFIRYANESQCNIIYRRALLDALSQVRFVNFISHCLKRHLCPFIVERFIFFRSEYFREEFRQEPAQYKVSIGDSQRATLFPVAYRARVSPGRFRSHLVEAPFKEETGATASSHCVDIQLGCLDAHPGDFSLEDMLVLLVVARDVGAGAAHVKTYNRLEILGVLESSVISLVLYRGDGIAHDSTCWP